MKKSLYFYSVLIIGLCSVMLSACDKLPFGPKSQPQPQPAPKVEKPIKGELLAQINDWRIGIEDFNDQVERTKKALSDAGRDVTLLDDRNTKVELLKDMITRESLAQNAVKSGMDKESDIVSDLEEYKRNRLVAKLSEELLKEVSVDDGEIKAYYDENKDKLNPALVFTPVEYKFGEIGLADDARAKDIKRQIEDGADFATLAKQYSELASKDAGGEIDYTAPVEKVNLSVKYWSKIASLENGEIASIKLEDGKNYIIRLEGKRGGQPRALTDEITVPSGDKGTIKVTIKELIKEEVRAKKLQEKIDAIVTEIKGSSVYVENSNLIK